MDMSALSYLTRSRSTGTEVTSGAVLTASPLHDIKKREDKKEYKKNLTIVHKPFNAGQT